MESKITSYVYDPVRLGKATHSDIDYQQNRADNWKTGIPYIDNNCTNVYEGQVVGIQAPTSNGKSTLMLAFAAAFAPQLQKNEVIVFCTWEDAVESFGKKLASRITRIPLQRMNRKGGLDKESLKRLKHAATDIQSGNIWAVGHSRESETFDRPTMTEIEEALTYIKSQGKIVKIIFMDYLQRISHDDLSNVYMGLPARFQEIMNRVKQVAVHTGAMVVIGTQVNERKHQSGADHMPQIADAMYTANFEQSCDTIFSMYIAYKFHKLGEFLGRFDRNNQDVEVTTNLIAVELQKQKDGRAPIFMPLQIDWDSGIITDYERSQDV